MGHRDSSSALGGRGSIRTARSGASEAIAEPSARGRQPLSLPALLLLGAIRIYQTYFSALMPSACKFYPSCSHYAADAVRIHGARRGLWLALKRFARCHPFTPGGVDLVPEAEWKPEKPGSNATPVTGRGGHR